MGIFGPGVGGGLLAAAGAVEGVGKGITAAGEQQSKMDIETKMNDLAQKREEAITRLQGSQEAARQETGIAAQNKNVQQEIAGRAGVAAAGRAASEQQLGEKLTSEEKRTERTATSRENVANIRAGATVAASKGRQTQQPEWKQAKQTLQGSYDAASKTMIPGQTIGVMQHRDGSMWVPAGDKLLPYDASKPGGLGTDPSALRRAPAAEVQKLLQNPLGTTPSGMSARDSFVQRNGYLPQQYMSAANTARDKVTNAQGGGYVGGGTAPSAPPAEGPEPIEQPEEPNSQAETTPPPMQ